MTEGPDTPFDSIEGAHQYVTLLAEALRDAQAAIQHDVAVANRAPGAHRRLQALRLVEYKLNQLGDHLSSTRGILNDLRTLRRLLLGEREETLSNSPESS